MALRWISILLNQNPVHCYPFDSLHSFANKNGAHLGAVFICGSVGNRTPVRSVWPDHAVTIIGGLVVRPAVEADKSNAERVNQCVESPRSTNSESKLPYNTAESPRMRQGAMRTRA